MRLSPLGDRAVVITLGSTVDDAVVARVRAVVAALEVPRLPGVADIVAAYATVTVFYEPHAFQGRGEGTPYDEVCKVLRDRTARTESAWAGLVKLGRRDSGAEAGRMEIPVCYGGDCGPDLTEVARHCRLPAEEVVRLHAGGDYQVHAVGFAPGFPYLGGLPDKLRTPRRATPRTSVPAGSVGIGWAQTGVYPLATPGGWQLIGRTPLKLFDASRQPPALLRVGDRVAFRAITAEEFAAWK